MGISRRQFLTLPAIGTSLLPLLASSSLIQNDSTLISCALDKKGNPCVIGIGLSGKICFSHTLPSRGHGIALHDSQPEAFVFARRPGDFIHQIDCLTGRLISTIKAQTNRFFFGHGCIKRDELYVVEGEKNSCEGSIGCYKLMNHQWQKVDEIREIGIGLHEIIALENNVLAIAVGGIQTQGRKSVNLPTMQSSIILIKRDTHKIIERYEHPVHQMSMRHLAYSPQGKLIAANQFMGEDHITPPLLTARIHPNKWVELSAKPSEWHRFENYIGSVACTENDIIATSPKGNCYGIWDAKSLQLKDIKSMSDVCGVGVKDNAAYLTSGNQKIKILPESEHLKETTLHTHLKWDNHLYVLK